MEKKTKQKKYVYHTHKQFNDEKLSLVIKG